MKNGIGLVLKVIGIIIMIIGVIVAGICLDYSWEISLAVVATSLITCFVFLGFAEIIQLLQEILYESINTSKKGKEILHAIATNSDNKSNPN